MLSKTAEFPSIFLGLLTSGQLHFILLLSAREKWIKKQEPMRLSIFINKENYCLLVFICYMFYSGFTVCLNFVRFMPHIGRFPLKKKHMQMMKSPPIPSIEGHILGKNIFKARNSVKVGKI